VGRNLFWDGLFSLQKLSGVDIQNNNLEIRHVSIHSPQSCFALFYKLSINCSLENILIKRDELKLQKLVAKSYSLFSVSVKNPSL